MHVTPWNAAIHLALKDRVLVGVRVSLAKLHSVPFLFLDVGRDLTEHSRHVDWLRRRVSVRVNRGNTIAIKRAIQVSRIRPDAVQLLVGDHA